MDDVIRQIVTMDSELRARVAACEARLAQMRKEDAQEGAREPETQARAQCESDKILERARAEAAQAAGRLEARYAREEAALRAVYDRNRGDWIQTLFERCIQTEEAP